MNPMSSSRQRSWVSVLLVITGHFVLRRAAGEKCWGLPCLYVCTIHFEPKTKASPSSCHCGSFCIHSTVVSPFRNSPAKNNKEELIIHRQTEQTAKYVLSTRLYGRLMTLPKFPLGQQLAETEASMRKSTGLNR